MRLWSKASQLIQPSLKQQQKTNMNSIVISTFAAVLLCLVSTTLAMPDHPHRATYADVPAKYGYQYAVADHDSGVNFGQSESRDGHATSGSYYVALPDGRTQKVVYTVNGDAGYIADVSYA